MSDYHLIKFGVPQGGVLGLLLYLIYIADIPQTDDTLLAAFADDTAIMSDTTDLTRASEKLQNYLNQQEDWLNQWKINVNRDKIY